MKRLDACYLVAVGLLVASVCGCVTPTSVTLHPASAMVRIGGADGAPIPPRAISYKIQMVRNEREGFQFAVLPPDVVTVIPYTQVDLHADSPNAPAFALCQVLPVNHVAPPTTGQFVVPARRLGQVPDVLRPLVSGRDKVTMRCRREGIPLTCYVEFHTTAKTPPGEYRYTLRAGGAPMRIVVDVREPIIPDRLPFRTATTWNWSLEDYFGRPLTPAEKRVFWDFFLDQRLSPTAFFARTPDPSPSEAVALKDRGLSVMNLTFIGGKKPRPLSPEFKDKLGPQLRQWREELRAAGMLDIAVVLLADEPVSEAAPVCRENAAWIKQQFPEAKIWVATRPGPAWDFADVFDPVTAYSTDFYKPHSHSDEALAWLRKEHPETEYWWFHSVEPYAPYTNLRLDNLPIEARVSGWQSALYGVDAYEYFWMTAWAENKESKDVPWPDRAAQWKTGMSGAGTLCYPDERGLPMPSLRLVNLRDGLEDWALVEMAAGRGDTAARRRLVGKVTRSLAEYTTDPQVVLRARARLIAAAKAGMAAQ